MEVQEAILERRARRMLNSGRRIRENEVLSLVEAAMLAPSCFNNQPWRITFVSEEGMLSKLKTALSKGNEWATAAPLILVVASKQEDDCVIKDREYFLFDCGLAIGQLVLRATELGMIAHPIAGYDPEKAREVSGIPEEYTVITLVICAYPGEDDALLSEKQKQAEKERPARKPRGETFFRDRWGSPL